MATEPDEAKQDRDLIEKARLLGIPGGTPMAMEAVAQLLVKLKNALTAADGTATSLSKRIVWLNAGLLLLTVVLVAMELLPHIYPRHGGAGTWVLWRETGSTVNPDDWKVESAWVDKQQCEAASAVEVERAVAKSSSISGWTVAADKDSPRSSYTTRSREGMWVTKFSCLPDTVDPRGPKGK